MKLSDLSPDIMERIKTLNYDRIIEKHEGPEDWEAVLKYHDPEFMRIDNCDVLLPVGKEQHPNITILRTIVGNEGKVLVVFLKDMTYVTDNDDSFLVMIQAGYMAVCEKMSGAEFYIATVYHEWFIIDNPTL
ncbi:MAG: hypothetical protein H7175_21980 [Burkholderiales bacterium]|nr:hypothetical protein [Anaerolineae bacterium]